MAIGIISTGTALPPRVVDNREVSGWSRAEPDWIVERTGIRTRHYADADESTSDLAARAADEALVRAGVCTSQLQALAVATSTPDQQIPATAAHVQQKLGISGSAAFDVNAVCSGYLYGLVLTSALLEQSHADEYGVVVGADTYSRIMDREDKKTVSLFGDGAGATVLGHVPDGYGLLGHSLTSDGSLSDLVRLPADEGRRDGADATPSYFEMDGRAVKEFAMSAVPKTVHEACDQAGVRASEIDRVILHQGNIRLVEALADELGVPRDKVDTSGEHTGNAAAASVPLTLGLSHDRDGIQRGDTVLLASVGGGMTTGAAVLRWY